MKLTYTEQCELNALLKKGKFDLPIGKHEVGKHNVVYEWLQKNILVRNAHRVTPRIAQLLQIQMPVKEAAE